MGSFFTNNPRIIELAKQYSGQKGELEAIFEKPTNVYVDYANVINWHKILNWHISLKRVKQLHQCFKTINKVSLYTGFFPNEEAEKLKLREENLSKKIPLTDDMYTINQLASMLGYTVRNKHVKVMQMSIDVSSIAENNPSLLQNFIDKELLKTFPLEIITVLNKHLKDLNDKGIKFIERRKCNFDVEIGTDMLLDCERDKKVETFVLWSGDSDFAEPIAKLIDKGKKVVLFATARRVRITTELERLKSKGLFVFEVKKIKEFICFPREMQKGSP